MWDFFGIHVEDVVYTDVLLQGGQVQVVWVRIFGMLRNVHPLLYNSK